MTTVTATRPIKVRIDPTNKKLSVEIDYGTLMDDGMGHLSHSEKSWVWGAVTVNPGIPGQDDARLGINLYTILRTPELREALEAARKERNGDDDE